ncbi:MAG TPA: radical SAM protein [Candidatus Brocadiia bacterium]|nr:radical SAM protein [Candidatus Brocadiia bacterium]
MYSRFGLVLMLNHSCNMRCDYCYVGRKFNRTMTPEIGMKAIDRAIASLEPGGKLELGFFGGEPLLEAGLILDFIAHAESRARAEGYELALSMTTNGTISDGLAWDVLKHPKLMPAISHDGLPEVHNRHRRFANGRDSSDKVLATISKLLASGKRFSVIMTVRPENVLQVPEGVVFLRDFGVARVHLTLDIWARWDAEDARNLEETITRCGPIWRDGLPKKSLNWFGEKAIRIAGIPVDKCARCLFGAGEIAVAPSGTLYPCERLIGEDTDDNPSRMEGHALDGGDFLGYEPVPERSSEACDKCAIRSACLTTCRCSNFVRTGNPARPDRLLCMFEQACFRETVKMLESMGAEFKVPETCEV